jgi:hypothetical protein
MTDEMDSEHGHFPSREFANDQFRSRRLTVREADQSGGVLVVRVDERSPSATFRQAAA